VREKAKGVFSGEGKMEAVFHREDIDGMNG